MSASFATVCHYPVNFLAEAFYRVRCRLGLATANEKRHEMVGPAHLWKMKRDFQIAFLKSQGLVPHHTLLDLGCGVLRGGMVLIDYLHVGHYWGFEVRKSVLDEGRVALNESGLSFKRPVLLAADSLDHLRVSERFDFVWAFSVLIHMSDGIMEESLAWVAAHLQDNGRFFANVIIDSGSDGDWQGFPVVHRSLGFYSAVAKRYGLRVQSLGTLASLGHYSGARVQDNQIMLEFRRA